MRVKIQIKGIRDFDILTLHYNRRFNLPLEIKTALAAYIRNTGEMIPLPSFDDVKEITLEAVQVNIPLDDINDSDIINFLSKIKKGYRASVIKSIFRNKLQEPVICASLIDGNNDIVIKKAVPIKETHINEKPKTEVKTTSTKPEAPGIIENEWDVFSGGFITNY